jgi:hypothetical protein
MEKKGGVQIWVVFKEYSKQVPSFSLIPGSMLTLTKESRGGKIPVGTVE